ncbi:hypothetical protein GWK47_052217 [Chionoecetes opilio]|uniref:Uncharacterized protein n=1 Tax=Chionoecetes opilio TaxID=41210 RepID=A0A8J4Y1I3_CHIOP|nr:hypothetical protein GWK47_052217 [Chionoecetes opilio]
MSRPRKRTLTDPELVEEIFRENISDFDSDDSFDDSCDDRDYVQSSETSSSGEESEVPSPRKMVYDVYGKASTAMRRLHLQGDDEEDVNEPQTSSVPTWLTSPVAMQRTSLPGNPPQNKRIKVSGAGPLITQGSAPSPLFPADADMPSPTRLDTPTPLPTSPQPGTSAGAATGKRKGKAASFQRRASRGRGRRRGGNIPAHHDVPDPESTNTEGETDFCGSGRMD